MSRPMSCLKSRKCSVMFALTLFIPDETGARYWAAPSAPLEPAGAAEKIRADHPSCLYSVLEINQTAS